MNVPSETLEILIPVYMCLQALDSLPFFIITPWRLLQQVPISVYGLHSAGLSVQLVVDQPRICFSDNLGSATRARPSGPLAWFLEDDPSLLVIFVGDPWDDFRGYMKISWNPALWLPFLSRIQSLSPDAFFLSALLLLHPSIPTFRRQLLHPSFPPSLAPSLTPFFPHHSLLFFLPSLDFHRLLPTWLIGEKRRFRKTTASPYS